MSDGGGDANGALAAGDEEAYERLARTHQSQAADKKPVDLLPFKTPDGQLQFDRSRSRAASALFAGSVAGISIVDDLAHAAEAPAPDGATDAAARVDGAAARKPREASEAEQSAQVEPAELHGGTKQPRGARKNGAGDREEAAIPSAAGGAAGRARVPQPCSARGASEAADLRPRAASCSRTQASTCHSCGCCSNSDWMQTRRCVRLAGVCELTVQSVRIELHSRACWLGSDVVRMQRSRHVARRCRGWRCSP